MTPIVIDNKVSGMTASELQIKLNSLAYTFCVHADFNQTKAISELVNDLEMHILEALLRIFEDKFEYVPYQNKIYEKTESYFDNQDAYNLNRSMSTLRRAKITGFDMNDEKTEKYIKWMRNRIRYGVKALIVELGQLTNTQVQRENDNVRQPVTV